MRTLTKVAATQESHDAHVLDFASLRKKTEHGWSWLNVVNVKETS